MIPLPTFTTCTSHRIGGPASVAAAAVDRLRHDLGGALVVDVDGGQLVLDGDGAVARRLPAAYWPVRHFLGTLRVGPFRRIPVEVEIYPWAEDESELTVRPAGNRPPAGRDSYLETAADAGRRLAELIDRRVRLADLAA